MQKFDYKGSVQYAADYMKGVVKGMDHLINLTADRNEAVSLHSAGGRGGNG